MIRLSHSSSPEGSEKKSPRQFVDIWNEFLFAVTILQKPELQPITVALRNLSGSQIKEWNMIMAGAIIAALPTLLVYIVMGRYFIRGLLAGSVKG